MPDEPPSDRDVALVNGALEEVLMNWLPEDLAMIFSRFGELHVGLEKGLKHNPIPDTYSQHGEAMNIILRNILGIVDPKVRLKVVVVED